jgi:hypothetical protein
MRFRQLPLAMGLVVVVSWGCGGTTFVGEDDQAGTGGGGKGVSGAAGSSAARGGSSTGGSSGTGAGGTGGSSSGGSISTGGSGNVGGSISTGGSGNVGGSISTGGSGNVGGSGGTAPSGGTGNVGGAGATAGTAGIAGTACTDPDAASTDGGVTVQSTTVGLIDSLTDYCDDTGNLVEHYCVYTPCVGPQRAEIPVPITGGTGNIAPCEVVPTGAVLPLPVDCAGRCKDGACERFCAQFDETFTFVSTPMGGPVTLQHQSGQFVECSITAEQNAFVCADPSLAGRLMTVVALGNCTPAYFTMGVDYADTALGQDCSYSCITIDPPPEIQSERSAND